MDAMESQITGWAKIYSTIGSDADQRIHQSSSSLAFGAGNSPVTDEFPAQKVCNADYVSICKRPVTRKMFPFDDVIMTLWKSSCQENT